VSTLDKTETKNTPVAPPVEIDTSLRPWWGFFAIFSIGFPLFFLFQPPLPEQYRQLPSFELVDQKNTTVDTTFFSDTPSIVNFIFTRCKDFCPALSQKMQYIQKQIPKARLASISVDPEYDTPTVLLEYGKRFQAGPSWFFLTGTREQITEVNSAFQQAYQENKSDDDAPNILHSQKFILVDQDGFIRGFYDDNSTDIRLLIKDYHRLKRFF
jgi:cytochrome oxidase Cu insertion factor (SCO1/SenC/PrrC family)